MIETAIANESDIYPPPPLRLALGRASVNITVLQNEMWCFMPIKGVCKGRVVTCENNAVTRDVCKGVCEGHMKNVLRLEILVERRNFKVDSHVV